jgi:hypothetical protein
MLFRSNFCVRSPTFTKFRKLLLKRHFENEPLKHRRFAYRIRYLKNWASFCQSEVLMIMEWELLLHFS